MSWAFGISPPRPSRASRTATPRRNRAAINPAKLRSRVTQHFLSDHWTAEELLVPPGPALFHEGAARADIPDLRIVSPPCHGRAGTRARRCVRHLKQRPAFGPRAVSIAASQERYLVEMGLSGEAMPTVPVNGNGRAGRLHIGLIHI